MVPVGLRPHRPRSPSEDAKTAEATGVSVHSIAVVHNAILEGKIFAEISQGSIGQGEYTYLFSDKNIDFRFIEVRGDVISASNA